MLRQTFSQNILFLIIVKNVFNISEHVIKKRSSGNILPGNRKILKKVRNKMDVFPRLLIKSLYLTEFSYYSSSTLLQS